MKVKPIKAPNLSYKFRLKDELLLPQITHIPNNARSKGICGITQYFSNQSTGGIRWELTGVPLFTSHKLQHALGNFFSGGDGATTCNLELSTL